MDNSPIQSTALLLQRAILLQDNLEFQKQLQKYLTQTISVFDTDKEGFYYGLMLGLYAVLNNIYSIKSNREAGDGRFDIQMEPFNKVDPGIVVELKVLHNPKTTDEMDINKQLDDLSKTALKQIDEKKYTQEVMGNGITHFLKYGISFYKKYAVVAFKEETISGI